MAAVSIEVLRGHPLFASCTEQELAAIADVTERRCAVPGEELIRQGASAAHLILVLEGEARVERDGREVNRIGAGGFTGEMAAVDGHEHTASVIAATEMDVLIVRASEAAGLLEHSGVAGRLMQRVVGWMRPPAEEETSPGWDDITPAEMKVIDLVAVGRSNPQVAAELFLSRYTVESHLKSIYSKLGISSRTELAVASERRRRS
jgi:DNA-binding NarL/FixJ family response regulator